jgi:hypothetical protein
VERILFVLQVAGLLSVITACGVAAAAVGVAAVACELQAARRTPATAINIKNLLIFNEFSLSI